LVLTVVGLLVAGISTPVLAEQTVSVPFAMPVKVNGAVSVTGCNNAPGPQITLGGVIELGGLQVDVIFRNNAKGTHETIVEDVVRKVLIDVGDNIEIPKQPVLGGVGGNPFIWIQFLTSKNQALTPEIYIGRCVQGGAAINPEFLNAVLGAAKVTSEGCQNSPGPTITLDGTLTFSGLKARFIFRNNDNPVGGPHVNNGTIRDVDIILEGTAITLPKSPAQGGVGGNPLIYLQFRQGNGAPIGGEIRLGRCNKI
jgi:hypothetical protein